MNGRDRFGFGYRPELVAGILAHRDEIDLLEVIADDYFDADEDHLRSLELLQSHLPIVLHGVSLGLASVHAVDEHRLACMKRLVARLQPECWSEHLAFVRASGIEIGHLTAPPRTRDNIDGAVRNLRRAGEVVGTMPVMENISTMLDPPGSEMSEAEWITRILEGAGCDLLLDLHNVYVNSINLGYDSFGFLEAIPLERVTIIHVAGGKLIEAPGGGVRVLDDHLHDVPDIVYELLTEVGRRTPKPIAVILERDGEYPPIDDLLEQLRRCRAALAAGRTRAMQVAGSR